MSTHFQNRSAIEARSLVKYLREISHSFSQGAPRVQDADACRRQRAPPAPAPAAPAAAKNTSIFLDRKAQQVEKSE